MFVCCPLLSTVDQCDALNWYMSLPGDGAMASMMWPTAHHCWWNVKIPTVPYRFACVCFRKLSLVAGRFFLLLLLLTQTVVSMSMNRCGLHPIHDGRMAGWQPSTCLRFSNISTSSKSVGRQATQLSLYTFYTTTMGCELCRATIRKLNDFFAASHPKARCLLTTHTQYWAISLCLCLVPLALAKLANGITLFCY